MGIDFQSLFESLVRLGQVIGYDWLLIPHIHLHGGLCEVSKTGLKENREHYGVRRHQILPVVHEQLPMQSHR